MYPPVVALASWAIRSVSSVSAAERAGFESQLSWGKAGRSRGSFRPGMTLLQ